MSDSQTHVDPSEATAADLEAWLIERIRVYDQVDADTITAEASLEDLGLDSIYALTLCGDFEDTYGEPLDPPVLAEYGTLGELAAGLAARLNG
ncbi:acyl carrier protein [Agromyces protaetiae]|uniref:Acyl carrier protein n=1 Tax=Agromyces protaetiae TaxID=2509455 RepID=A0A4P6FHU2_9MICO|nr:acyl carrier protein [Agromyces protaetiae]QAY74693.1 acyl carrier protein [Agromyces protaetiae]